MVQRPIIPIAGGSPAAAPEKVNEGWGSRGDFMRLLKTGLLWVVLIPFAYAVVQHQTISYKPPVKRIAGRVTGFGRVNPDVQVQVLDKPEVWSNDSLSFVEKRKKQSIVASATTDSSGKFEFHGIPRGCYEVEFSNRQGWNVLSVFVVVDPRGSSQKLCVEMSLEGGGGSGPSVQPCRR